MSEKSDFVRFWAEEFKRNSRKNRKLLKLFANSQILLAQKQLKKLPTEKTIKIFDIRNEEIIKQLYKKNKNIVN
ncbi:MAG: hypothetical protein ACTSQI_12175 [Candidatus Helarchaeota archaeon]